MAKNKKRSASANGAAKNAIDGRAIAASAIEEMHDVKDDAKEFVEECRRKGRDPQEVVAFIAAREGFLLGQEEPKDKARKSLYVLLKEVIREAVYSSYACNSYLCGWKNSSARCTNPLLVHLADESVYQTPAGTSGVGISVSNGGGISVSNSARELNH